MTRGRMVLAGLLLAGVTVLVSLVVTELGLRFVVRPPQTYRMHIPGMQYSIRVDSTILHGVHGEARYSVNQDGIRGAPFGPDAGEYRILLVGGSTTECNVLDESENWGTIAGRELGTTRDGRRIWVGNVGRSGLTARDNAVTVKYLLPQHPRIDLVIVLVGVNDLTAAIRQGAAYQAPLPVTDPAAEQRQIRNAFALSPGGSRETLSSTQLTGAPVPWYQKLRLFQLVQRARIGWQAREVAGGLGGASLQRWRDHRRSAPKLIDTMPDLTAALADYRLSLLATAEAARTRGATVMFMTQPALWKADVTPAEERLLWLGGTGNFQEEPGHEYYAVPALADAMRRYNDVTLDVCRQQGLPCFDLASHVPRDTLLLYDDVHFTEKGSALIGRLVADQLRAARPDLFAPAPAAPASARPR